MPTQDITSATLTSGALMSGTMPGPHGTPAPQPALSAPGLPGILPAYGIRPPPALPLGFPQLMVQVLPAQAALAAHLQQQHHQQSIAAALAHAAPMPSSMAPPAQMPARVASPTYRHTGRAQAAEAAAGSRAPVSHSTVEKQRRDRINSLIDELRDLVPPTQQQQQQQQMGLISIGVGDNPEASSRRPKHVVLADTINLLKGLRQRVSFAAVTAELQQLPAGGSGSGGGMLPTPVPVAMPLPGMYGAVAGAGMVPGMPGSGVQPMKQEPQGSSSQEDDDMGRLGGPGVTVKKGPDCFYVQVTCPDRKGLLSDITDTLRNLSLEVRTAAVTTTGGSVRDVFEVVPPDGTTTLAPEAVQSMVQGALSQRASEGQQEVTAGKRPRA
ncbi:hypothetical protein HXX76_006589 [Chlamydomonas incerta]|uniref:BHLH domain-containing protein n=1 Tax=Chlamydomonas incerta TaxID=51695 RepID=A0A835T556_CHLIN|nr:hypothetical protein HXX76_006589 [Chlamydomonas incerta]|eukprot:KAG2436278.1 hypothetical protein HXX76_006589 [Chlamydomonas incerta]